LSIWFASGYIIGHVHDFPSRAGVSAAYLALACDMCQLFVFSTSETTWQS